MMVQDHAANPCEAPTITDSPEAPLFLRRADPDDVDTICSIFDHLFGDDVHAEHFANFHGLNTGALRSPAAQQRFFVSLIETCFMSVTFEDELGNIAGFAALDDAPIQMMNTVGAGTNWEDWFQKTFQDPSIDNKNALWFACLLSEPDTNAMAEMLRTTFSTMLELEHLLLFVPANTSEEEVTVLLQPFETHFQQLELASTFSPPAGHWAANSVDGKRATVLICSRSDIITPLNIRMAKVEDHDNLAAVFDAQSEVITEIYGEYFIAELIEAQNDENKALVAEVDGRAVGLLCLTSDVDINVLTQCFDLDPYDNLLKPQVMGRIRQHAEATWSGVVDASLASVGDYLQVAMASIDVDALMEPLPRMDDGQINAAYLHGALAQQEFASEVGETVPDFGKAVMTLLWQARFTEPMLEMGSAVDPQQVGECVQMFRELDFKARKEVANRILQSWEEVQSIFEATRELLQQQAEHAREEAQQASTGEEQELTQQTLLEGEEEEEEEVQAIPIQVILKALMEEQEGPFSQDLLAKMIMCLHWWVNLDLGSPVKTVSEELLEDAVNALKDSEEGLFVNSPDSPAWLANLPQHTKDVFCINMCCLDQAYMTQAIDFLLPAFALYPHKDYCIVTQPHTAPNTPLLNAFTIVPPQPQNTFGHVLYLIHRASLLGPPGIRYLEAGDVSAVEPLVENFETDAQEEIADGIEQYLATREFPKADRPKHVFVAEFDEQIVGLIMLQVPEEDAIGTLRCCYHLDDYLLLEHHENHDRKGPAQLLHYTINPLFQKYTRRLHQGAMRICGKTVLFMEVDLNGTVSPIFRELLQVAPRRPPQLKKVLRKPPKVATFANVEKEAPTEEDLKEKARQKLLRDNKQTKALSVVSKKLLSETKIPVNARIVVVGASDCGLSLLESLLSIPHLVFNSLILLAPGGLEYHHAHHLPLVAGTAAYSHHELRRIMLEMRVRILDSRMVQIDRQQRCCILHDGAMLPYDYLVVAAGRQDDALHALRIRSCGVEHVTDGYRHVNGAMSVADPSIRDLLVEGGTLIKSLIWNPLSCAVVYGRSLHAYCVLQGLLMRKVPPTKIILVLPPENEQTPGQHNFKQSGEVECKIHSILEEMDIKVYEGCRLLGIQQDNRERLKTLVLEEGGEGGAEVERRGNAASDDGSQHSARAPADAGVDEGGDDGATSPRIKCGILEDNGVSPNGFPQKLLACRVLITADDVNVDPDIFNSVHGNGLVYDGRLIVDHNFKTTDDAIFGAGSLCEFSRRFQRKNAERYLRHDGFNGREVGAKLAQVLLQRLDTVNGDAAAAGAKGGNAGMNNIPEDNAFESMDPEESSPELLPEFYMPIAKAGFLPGNLHYYRIASCRKGEVQDEQGEPKADRVVTTDTLDTNTGKGHYCRLTSDNFGKVDSITYLGGEELQVESLWSLVGVSETFLNHLFVRWRDGDIPDIVEFLTDDWATALFHDRFMDFCHQIKSEMAAQEDIKEIIHSKLKGLNLKEGLSRELLAQICEKLPQESVQLMQDHLLEYLRENTNHLKTYFLPENWRHDHYQPPR